MLRRVRPDDPARADEAALLYVQQRILATRDLGEGERVVAAHKLYTLLRACAPAVKTKTSEASEEGDVPQRYQRRSSSARQAAAAVGVSPRSLERYNYIRKHAQEALGEPRAEAVLTAIEAGETRLGTAERGGAPRSRARCSGTGLRCWLWASRASYTRRAAFQGPP